LRRRRFWEKIAFNLLEICPVFDISQTTFLIIDDFAQMRSLLKQMLLSLGMAQKSVEAAANAREAAQLMMKRTFDVVLCDYNLGPGKNGQQLLEEGRIQGWLRPQTLFVMITAENTMDMVLSAVDFKPDDYLTKPFNKGLLKLRLEKLFDRKHEMLAIEEAMAAHDFSAAVARCDERLAARPKSMLDILRLKGEALINLRHWDEASAVYATVMAIRRMPWAILGMARIEMGRGHLPLAEQHLRTLISETPTFMDAYDLLSRVLRAQGDRGEEQRILQEAVKISPNSFVRQRALGEVARINNDLPRAEQALRRVVNLAEGTLHERPVLHNHLAEVLSSSGSSNEAFLLLQQASKRFRGDEAAQVELMIGQSRALEASGNGPAAQQLLQSARDRFTKLDKPGDDVKIALGQRLLETGDVASGTDLLQSVVGNNHETTSVLDEVQAAFERAGHGSLGRDMIVKVTGEVVDLNNRGVALARQGKLDEARRLFDDAVMRMPDNVTILLNSAQVELLRMRKGDVSARERGQLLVARATRLNPLQPRLATIRHAFGL
jgi:DNA-binding response OmpR family regulator/Tfp pilus assembly protein PilF